MGYSISLNFNKIIFIASWSQNLDFKIQILAGNSLKICLGMCFEISTTLTLNHDGEYIPFTSKNTTDLSSLLVCSIRVWCSVIQQKSIFVLQTNLQETFLLFRTFGVTFPESINVESKTF